MSQKTVEAGDKAPAFSLQTGAGRKIRLRDFAGRTVVLYFYPKDNTSGCTRQACDFRDSAADLKRAGAVVLGVSPDSLGSHERFAGRFQLGFPLLSDPDHAVAERYGVWVEKSMYGRKYFGIERSTFVIDGDGRIVAVWRKVKVPGHIADVLSRLAQTAPESPVASPARRKRRSSNTVRPLPG